MNLGEQLLAALSAYGLPILAAAVFVGSLGLPLPNALVLIAAGSFTAAGQMDLPSVILAATIASIAGDLLGYGVGRWAGDHVLNHIVKRPKMKSRLGELEAKVREWGGAGVFISRWLTTPLGPWVNLLSGISHYSFTHFLFWDVMGEVLWVVLYVSAGRIIGGEVQAIGALASDITWIFVPLVIAAILAWRMILVWRKRPRTAREQPVP